MAAIGRPLIRPNPRELLCDHRDFSCRNNELQFVTRRLAERLLRGYEHQMVVRRHRIDRVLENRPLEQLHARVLDIGLDCAPSRGPEARAKCSKYGLMMPRGP